MGKTYTYNFIESGAVIEYRKINAVSLQLDARRMLEPMRPEPPVEMVNLAGVEQEYQNKQHPKYLEQVSEWLQQVNDLYAHIAIDMAVVRIVEPNDWRAQTERYIEKVNKYVPANGEKLSIDDHEMIVFYIERLAAGTSTELKDFYTKIQEISVATEEGIQEKIESFRPDEHNRRNGTALPREDDLHPAEDETIAAKL